MKYRYHNDDSRKGWVHLAYDLFGEDDARILAVHFGIEKTAEQWFRFWKRTGGQPRTDITTPDGKTYHNMPLD